MKMLGFVRRYFSIGAKRSMHDMYTRQQSLKSLVLPFQNQQKIIQTIIHGNRDSQNCIRVLSKLYYKTEDNKSKVYLSQYKARDLIKEHGITWKNIPTYDINSLKPLIHMIVYHYQNDEETAKYLISQLFVTSDNGNTRTMLNPTIVNHHYLYFMKKVEEMKTIKRYSTAQFYVDYMFPKDGLNQHELIEQMVERYQHDYRKCYEILSRLYMKNEENGEKIHFTKEEIELMFDILTLSPSKMCFSFQEQYLTIHQIVREYKEDKETAIQLLKELYYHDPSNKVKKIYMSDELAETYFNLYLF